MSVISTHVIDTSTGRPASRVPVVLEVQAARQEWKLLAKGATDAAGRLQQPGPLAQGTYRLRFDTSAWFSAQSLESFYPEVIVVFTIRQEQHYHIPLLLSPYGYTTYRGS